MAVKDESEGLERQKAAETRGEVPALVRQTGDRFPRAKCGGGRGGEGGQS